MAGLTSQQVINNISNFAKNNGGSLSTAPIASTSTTGNSSGGSSSSSSSTPVTTTPTTATTSSTTSSTVANPSQQVLNTQTNSDGSMTTTYADGHTAVTFPRSGNTNTGGAGTTGSTNTVDNANAGVDPTAPLSLNDAVNQIYSILNPAINAAQTAETSAEMNANLESQQNTATMNQEYGEAGLAGSTAASKAASLNQQQTDAQIAAAKNTQAQAIAAVSETAASVGESLFTNEKSFNATQGAALIAKNLASGQAAIKNLASAGVSLSQYQQQDPTGYQNLVQAYNGDENSLKADFVAASTPKIIGDPIVNGNQVTFLQVDPTNPSKPISTTLTLPFTNLSAQDVKVIPNQGLFVRDPNTNQWTYVGGQNQTYAQNQDLTIQTKQQNLDNRKALEATKIVGSQISKDASIQNFMAVQPIMQRIQSAMGEINSGNLNEANAGALLDDITKLNTQGQAITSGQIDLTNSSLSFADQAKVLAQKVSGSGGVIDSKVAQDIYKLAQDNYNLYNKAYQDHIKIYNSRLSNVNGQDLTSYSPLTDISNLPAVVDGSYASGLQSSVQNAPDPSATDTSSAVTASVDDYLNGLNLGQ